VAHDFGEEQLREHYRHKQEVMPEAACPRQYHWRVATWSFALNGATSAIAHKTLRATKLAECMSEGPADLQSQRVNNPLHLVGALVD